MPRRFRIRRALPLAFAVLALLGLLARGTVPAAAFPAPAAGNWAVLAKLGAVICHADPTAGHNPPTPGHSHAPDCTLCLVCQLHGPGALLLRPTPPTVHIPPASAPAARFVLAPPRAPPAAAWRLAQPRGPPIPV